MELRAATDGQRVRLGIMDWTQPANGSEITFEEKLTTHWSTVALPLSLFANVDPKHTYVALELVFHGSASETVEMRNLRYSPDEVAGPELSPADMPFPVYTDFADPGNHYVPSGFMGDRSAVTITENWTGDPHDGKTCIKVTYGGPVAGGAGWAGAYWQDPVDNWGTVPGQVGYDLSQATRLTFWVRGETGRERVKFLVGGIEGTHGDSLNPLVNTPVLRLSTAWRQVTIDLTEADLTVTAATRGHECDRHAILSQILATSISDANQILGAKWGANGGRRRATQGVVWRRSGQLAGTSGDISRRQNCVLQARGHWFEPSCAH
jgi:hypothetical protein